MPAAASSRDSPSDAAIRSIAASAAPRSSGRFPPMKAVAIEIAKHDVGVGDGRGDAAIAVTGRSRHRARAFRADMKRAAGIDAGDRAAAGRDTRNVEATQRDALSGQHTVGGQRGLRPSEISEMSVLVPPMSNGTRSAMPSSSAQRRPPETPPAGPDSTVPAASREASSTGAMPPCDSTTKRLPLKPASTRRCSQIGQIAPHHRFDIGVHDRGRDALIFLDLRQHVAGARDADTGQLARPDARPPRVRGRG